MELVNRWEKDIYIWFSYNIMERGLVTGDMHISTLVVLGQRVGYLIGSR